jgi:predicted dehydrogenase
MTLRFAVVGTGWAAGEYVRAIRANPGCEVYAVVSRDEARAKRLLAAHGVQARTYATIEAAVNDPAVDAVVLCSTPDVRPEQAVLAARYGKHMILEKPLAMDRAGLDRMTEALRANPVRTTVGFVLRWNPLFTTIKALIDDDALGRVFMAQLDYWNCIGPQFNQYRWSTSRRLGGSSMLSAGCHAVDALRLFAGDIAEVTAYSCRTRANSDYEFDPNVIAMFKLKNGGIGKVSSSLECRTPYKLNVHLLGEKGAIMNNRLFSHKFPGQTDYAEIPTILPENGDADHFPFEHEVADFAASVRDNKPTRCDFEEARKTMDVCFAIDEAIASGKSIRIES